MLTSEPLVILHRVEPARLICVRPSAVISVEAGDRRGESFVGVPGHRYLIDGGITAILAKLGLKLAEEVA